MFTKINPYLLSVALVVGPPALCHLLHSIFVLTKWQKGADWIAKYTVTISKLLLDAGNATTPAAALEAIAKDLEGDAPTPPKEAALRIRAAAKLVPPLALLAFLLCACSVAPAVTKLCPACTTDDPFLVAYAKNLSISDDILVHLEKEDLKNAPNEAARIALFAHYRPAWDSYTYASELWFKAFAADPTSVDAAGKSGLNGAWQAFQAAIDASQPPAR